jgi:hypothetical protein
MPWQQYVADVAGEFDPVSGRPYYRTVVVSVMRQQGKSVLVLAKNLVRCTLWDRPQVCVYTAQTGFEAGKKVIKEWHPQIKRSPMRALLAQDAHLGLRRAAGNQGIDFRNESRLDVQASGVASGHGDAIDDGTIDEAWHDHDYRREQSLRPAMLTRADAQIWVVSTAGTDESLYWNSTQDNGRAAALADEGKGVAYFEWSCPESLDPLDPDGWPLYMPALGHTVDVETIQQDISALQMEPTEIARAYGNIRQSTGDGRIIPDQAWQAVCSDQASPDGRLSFGVDVSPDRQWGSIAVAGGGVLELVECRPGAGWLVDRCREIGAAWAGPMFAVDSRSAAASLIPELERAGLRVEKVSRMADACGAFFDAVADRTVTVRHDPRLDDAVASAQRRPVGDAWVWGRKETDISPLVAATLALWVSTVATPSGTFVSW